jgi:hypothetical protein
MKAGGSTIPKDEMHFFTAEGPILSPEDLDNILNGRRIVTLVFELSFADDYGTHSVEGCEMLEAPQVSNVPTWISCEEHNGEK